MKVALVTGAGSGIGRAVALALAAEGFSLALAGRRFEKLAETAALIGKDCLPIAVDISDAESVKTLFSQIGQRWGRLDLLFNSAGTGAPGRILLEDIGASDWQMVVGTNLSGAFFCIQGAFQMMKTQKPMGGRIINNGSISAHVPRPNSAPYTATKHAMTGLTKSAALDGRKYNIAVGQIDIGNAASVMTDAMATGMPQANGTIASEPVMDVTIVAQAVRHMASLPLEANVQFMTIMATKMPFVGRG